MANGNRNIVGSIDLGELFAMPLEALINADAEAAKTFAAFIQEYGFERPGPGGGGNQPYGKLKMVSFSYYRPVAGGQPQAFHVEVPLILLIPLPTLAIRDAQLDFSVEIFGMVDQQSSDPGADDSDKGGDGETPSSPAPLPRRLQRPQLRTRIARAPRTAIRTTAGATNYREEVSTKIQMTVKVNVAESDLPEGINQLLNLTAQATTDVEMNFPYINIVAESGKTMLTSIGDFTTLILTLAEADGSPMPNQTVSLSQDLPNIFQLPVGPINTDQNGQARAEISLILMPDTTPVMKTITASATVQTSQYDAVDAMGTIRIEVDQSTS